MHWKHVVIDDRLTSADLTLDLETTAWWTVAGSDHRHYHRPQHRPSQKSNRVCVSNTDSQFLNDCCMSKSTVVTATATATATATTPESALSPEECHVWLPVLDTAPHTCCVLEVVCGAGRECWESLHHQIEPLLLILRNTLKLSLLHHMEQAEYMAHYQHIMEELNSTNSSETAASMILKVKYSFVPPFVCIL